MKATPVVLAVLTLLAGACTSFQNPPQTAVRERAELGIRATKWGRLHEFEPVAPLSRSRFVRGGANVPSGSAVVELLISPDGKVLDAAVVESSGKPAVDDAAKVAFAGVVFPRVANYASSEPYVARHRVQFTEGSGMAMREFVGWPSAQ